ncbi:hypothetical protein SCHPADRAFT_630465 [Schizopora paradoxa]|uniref:DUF6533 domain-containing protein n=1 Tax=Schizopora paradoxa TaxID=27342 RepID=A0A0H2R7K5_9AGAM|nr:hypothetical protein SCHPADRAFT_630465 [Schizopora paradoxa]
MSQDPIHEYKRGPLYSGPLLSDFLVKTKDGLQFNDFSPHYGSRPDRVIQGKSLMNTFMKSILIVPSQYTLLGSYTVVLYDYFLTLNDEINLMWRKRFSLINLLFFVYIRTDITHYASSLLRL